ncbi:MAG: type II toxin-antitoxin system HicA family toxin [Nevskiales bacterium]
MKYRDFVRIIEQHGFAVDRQRGTHRQFKGMIAGRLQLVTVDYAQSGEDISPRNLSSMIRQSGLPKKLFR